MFKTYDEADMADAFDWKKVQICYVVNKNEDFLCHFLYKIRTLVVLTYDFSGIYDLSIYDLWL